MSQEAVRRSDQAIEDVGARTGIESAERIVEDHEGRPVVDAVVVAVVPPPRRRDDGGVSGPGEGHALLLSPAERHPPLPDLGRVPPVELLEVRKEAARVEYFLVPHRIVTPTEQHVVPQRHVQHERRLGCVGDVPGRVRPRAGPADGPRLAEYAVQLGRLAGADGTAHGEDLPPFEGKIEGRHLEPPPSVGRRLPPAEPVVVFLVVFVALSLVVVVSSDAADSKGGTHQSQQNVLPAASSLLPRGGGIAPLLTLAGDCRDVVAVVLLLRLRRRFRPPVRARRRGVVVRRTPPRHSIVVDVVVFATTNVVVLVLVLLPPPLPPPPPLLLLFILFPRRPVQKGRYPHGGAVRLCDLPHEPSREVDRESQCQKEQQHTERIARR